MDYSGYCDLKRRLVPGLRSNQNLYAETLERFVTSETMWLDAGCGHQVFPFEPDREEALVRRARRVFGCDLDEPGLHNHQTIDRVAVSDLSRLPYRTATFDLVTANMVVEHLAAPAPVLDEVARVLRPHGRLIIHTPNAWSYLVAIARLLPDPLMRKIDGRPPEDFFPAYYRANHPRRLQRLLRAAGFERPEIRMVASDAATQGWRWAAAAELLFIRATMTRLGRPFRVSMIITTRRRTS
jgi:SAM-dependent methyltransferase